MQRNTRNTRNAVGKPFVSGGVISNFTGDKPIETLPSTNNIQIPIVETIPPPAQNLTVTEPFAPMDIGKGNNETSTEGNGAPKKRWNRQPINKKIKRIRRNRRLRKMLIPKNALMSLNELMGSTLSDYDIVPEERGFVARVYVNNVQYEGRGSSKVAAKNNVSEKALRDIIIQKMVQTPKSILKGNVAGGGDDLFTEDIDMIVPDTEEDEATEVPMLHLASFALHKLFTEWQADGFEIPDFKNMQPPGQPGQIEAPGEKIPQQPLQLGRTEVPEKANTMHPTTLLCMMRPNVKYVDLGSEGTTPNILHRVGVEVDNLQFIGVGKNKKLARKNAALEACTKLFNIEFVKDEQ